MVLSIPSTLCRHALACGVLLLVGVSSNVAVIWIHTRKNSRVPRDEFALVLAGISIFALVTSLPMLPLIYAHVDLNLSSIQVFRISAIFNYCFQFLMNYYLVMLLMGTLQKIGEVMFTCKFCNADTAPFFKVVFCSIFGVALGSMFIYESTRMLKANSSFDAFGTFHTMCTALLVIFCALMHAKLQCSRRKMTSANIRR